MSKARLIVSLLATLWGVSAFAGAQCEGPQREGNTWNLNCSADGSGDSNYQCDYFFALTTADGMNYDVEASGSVAPGDSGIIIWSAIQYENADITSARLLRGTCIQ